MNLSKYRHIAFRVAINSLFLIGLLSLLNGASQVVRADPGALFVTPGGGGDCSQASPCSLQTALAQAADGDTLYIAGGIYTSPSGAVITITHNITLYGGWDGSPIGPVVCDPEVYPTTLDGEGAHRVAYITGAIAPVLNGLTFANGNATGLGGYNTTDAGGGIYVYMATPLIVNCTVISNTAGSNGTGGGIFLQSSNARLENSLVISNTAQWGGGVRAISGSPTFRHNRFISNTTQYGGGIYLMWTSNALIEGNTFQGNVGSNGGGISLSGAGATIRENLIQGNQGSTGGGITIMSGAYPVVIAGNYIRENTAWWGGGIYIQGNPAQVDNNFIARNDVILKGAGIYIKQASPSVRHNTLAQNMGEHGSGVFVEAGSEVMLTNTILVSHTVGISVTEGSTVTLQGTLWGMGVWANETDWGGNGDIFTGTVNLWDDPAFVDPDNGDYHISPRSVAIDAGVDAGVTIDVDGDLRPVGAGYDIGADEYAMNVYLPLVLKNYP